MEPIKIEEVGSPIEVPKETLDLIDVTSGIVRKIGQDDDATEERTAFFEELIEKLRTKNIKGFLKYGEFKFENNDMYQMAEEEILDAINYMSYEVVKISHLDFPNKELQMQDVLGFISILMNCYSICQGIRTQETVKLEQHFNSNTTENVTELHNAD